MAGRRNPGLIAPMNKKTSYMTLSRRNAGEGKIHEDHLASKILLHYSRYHGGQDSPFVLLRLKAPRRE